MDEGEAYFGRWLPCPADSRSADTYRMKVPGGWLVRVYDTVHHVERSATPYPTEAKLTIKGVSHVIFVPDPTISQAG